MNFQQMRPPRAFGAAGDGAEVTWDCGSIRLDAAEQVTFVGGTPNEAHTDITRRSWGYYLTRSCNDRQRAAGWRTAIIRNALGRTYVVMVQDSHAKGFERFLSETDHTVVLWVDELS